MWEQADALQMNSSMVANENNSVWYRVHPIWAPCLIRALLPLTPRQWCDTAGACGDCTAVLRRSGSGPGDCRSNTFHLSQRGSQGNRNTPIKRAGKVQLHDKMRLNKSRISSRYTQNTVPKLALTQCSNHAIYNWIEFNTSVHFVIRTDTCSWCASQNTQWSTTALCYCNSESFNGPKTCSPLKM